MTKEQAEEAAQWMDGRASLDSYMAEGHRCQAEPGVAEECEQRALRYRRVALALRAHWPLVEALENTDLVCHCGREERCESGFRHPCSYIAKAAVLALARKEP